MTKNTVDKHLVEETNDKDASNDISTTYLTFSIDGQHYGIPIGNVIEILQIQPTTELPELPSYSKGIINLRGQVVPIIDVNLRFGREEKEYTDRTCIIIADVDGVHTGLIVDSVEEVLVIDKSRMSVPPTFRADSASKYITRIARMEKNMVLLLNIGLMVSNSD